MVKNKAKLVVLVGLPASGKSTYALDLVRSDPDKYLRINFDSLRECFFGGIWSKEKEALLRDIAIDIALTALVNGKDVILDNTNLTGPQWDMINIIQFFTENPTEFKSFMDVPLDELIERDSQREKSVGQDVILRLYGTARRNSSMIEEETEGLVRIL